MSTVARKAPRKDGPQEIANPMAAESDRIRERRQKLNIPLVKMGGTTVVWGLALSGGGIRSATLSLGVLQALARARVPSAAPPAPDALQEPPAQGRSLALLRMFDYLSTVSGGGYIGSFFASLFVRGRLSGDANETATTAAEIAYNVFAYEPPGRLRFADDYAATPPTGKGPLAWLRDNGRYLSPTSAGDTLYGAVMAVRNWASVQYVLGTLLLFVLGLIAIVRLCLSSHAQLGAFQAGPLWLVPLALIGVLVLPLGIAFWLAQQPRSGTEQSPARFDRAVVCSLILGAVIFGVGGWLRSDVETWDRISWIAIIVGGFILLACAYYCASLLVGEKDIAYKRVLLTRWLKTAVVWTLVSASVVAIDSASAWLYAELSERRWGWPVTSSAALALAVWLVRHVTRFLDDKKKPSSAVRVPLDLLATIAGALLLVLVAIAWGTLVQAVEHLGHGVTAATVAQEGEALLGLLFVAAILGVATAMFPGFVNGSTFQSLYGARLTRAYLGASNQRRYRAGTEGKSARSVAEPIEGDQLAHATYYGANLGDVLAPLHIINITLNQTVDPTEQLVQRDRKGKPFAIVPAGFSIDENQYKFAQAGSAGISLSIGQWVGTSGAAVSTGLGRTTSLGFSFLLGMANVRLGRWWKSGCEQAPGRIKSFLALFPTQTLLLYELTAKFHGLRRPWQYLSDGGHFENTGLYELLRDVRKVNLMVVCDNGRDIDYQLEDLANLIRLARIDFRLEIEVDTTIKQTAGLDDVFGTPEQFSRNGNQCAMLLNVRQAGADGAPSARIILLKPRLVDGLPIDVRQYAAAHADFPQESTADQFFNEAQWESYRKLGLSIGSRVFDGAAGAALWRYLQLA